MEFIVDVNVVVVVVVVGQAGRHFETKRQKFESFLELRSLRLKAKVKTDVELEKKFRQQNRIRNTINYLQNVVLGHKKIVIIIGVWASTLTPMIRTKLSQKVVHSKI